MVKASASKAEDPGFKSCLRRNYSGSKHTSDLETGTPVTTQPGAWHYRVSTGTGRPSVSILWLSEVKVWSATSVSVWQHIKLSVHIRPWDTLACYWDVKQPTNKPFPSCCLPSTTHPNPHPHLHPYPHPHTSGCVFLDLNDCVCCKSTIKVCVGAWLSSTDLMIFHVQLNISLSWYLDDRVSTCCLWGSDLKGILLVPQ